MFIAVNETGDRFCSFESDEASIRVLSRAKALICPDCLGVVNYRAGTKKPHFYHVRLCTNPNPYSENESETHRSGKFLLYEWLKRMYPDGEVHLEYYLPETRQRSDIMMIHPDGQRWAVEFQCSKITGEIWSERHELYKGAGIHDIWVLNHGIRTRYKYGGFRFIALEHAIYESNRQIPYLNPESSEITLINEYFQEGHPLKSEFTSKLEHTYISKGKLTTKMFENFQLRLLEEEEERQREEAERAEHRSKKLALQQQRRQMEVEKATRDPKEYYRKILNERATLTKEMTNTEKQIFIRLAKRNGFHSENFPAALHLEVQYSDLIRTPKQLWQLWVFDQLVSQWDYFIKHKKEPKVWLENITKKFKELKRSGTFRAHNSNEEDVTYTFVLYNYFHRLNEIGILANLGSTTTKY